MKNKHLYTLYAIKIISFVLCFALIFLGLQFIFSDVHNATTTTVNMFYSLEEDSVDVLFLGSSQMFCGIDAKKLTEEYGISTFDFGSGAQQLTATCYYLREALKRLSPKVVAVEVSQAFNAAADDETILNSYPAMPMTAEKWESLKMTFDGNIWEAARYFFPLIAYHSFWNQINPLETVKKSLSVPDTSSRGFAAKDTVEKVRIEYPDGGKTRPVPEAAAAALKDIGEQCMENGIKLVFFKTPVAAEWSGNDSKTVKAFMSNNNFEFIDINDHMDEIGIDPGTDFYDEYHMNASGADKTTDFIADYIQELLA